MTRTAGPIIPSTTLLMPGIPKVIYQVYATKDLPPVIGENAQRIQSLNPGWNYRLFDDNEMIEFVRATYGEKMLSCYERINPKYGAARADLFRYLLMYKFGGVYLDIKSSMTMPLDQVLQPDDVYLLSKWSSGKGQHFEGWGKHSKLKQIGGEEFQQWHIVAAAGHPFLKAVIESVVDNIDRYNPVVHDTGKNGVLKVTGPIAYSLAISPLLDTYPHRLIDSGNQLGLVYSIFGSAVGREHKSIFRFHYTELQEPVIQLTGTRKFLWVVLGPIRNHIVNRFAGLYQSLQRRLRRLFGLTAADT
jgi:inositol phosphorylceramide mannosyltransferase catalytic subunit